MMQISKIGSAAAGLGTRKRPPLPIGLLPPPLPGIRSHPCLGVHSQPVCHAVYIIEVAYHLHGNGKGLLAEAFLLQPLKVRLSGLPRGKSQLHRVVAERSIRRREPHFPVVKNQLVCPGLIP